ncbi:MAG: T9SS type A sorting domain-containing protein [Bacteroidetes bacterium]|nr:T9SS type A sorting domain-containing protein [Bacteroidota bacterium]
MNFSPQDWKQLQGSPDYFHSSFSPPCPVIGDISNYQLANDGLGFVGIDVYCPVNICPNNYDKESVQCKLNDTLRFGKRYCVSFYVNLSSFFYYATDDIGIYFGVDSNLVFPAIPDIENTQGNFLTDTTNWVLIKGTYVASGDEVYLNLGNFKLNSATSWVIMNSGNPNYDQSYYFIDNVSVFELPVISANNDTSICLGEVKQLQVSCVSCWQGNNFEWRDEFGNLIGTGATINVSPMQATTYYVNLIDSTNSVSNINDIKDSINISVINCGVGVTERIDITEVNIYPNPANNILNVEISGFSNQKNMQLSLCNLLGESIANYNIENYLTKLNLSNIQNGIYNLCLLKDGKQQFVQKLVLIK